MIIQRAWPLATVVSSNSRKLPMMIRKMRAEVISLRTFAMRLRLRCSCSPDPTIA